MNVSVPPDHVNPPAEDEGDSPGQADGPPTPSQASLAAQAGCPANRAIESIQHDEHSQPARDEAGQQPPTQQGAANGASTVEVEER
jgi:hypothetical protein